MKEVWLEIQKEICLKTFLVALVSIAVICISSFLLISILKRNAREHKLSEKCTPLVTPTTQLTKTSFTQ